MSAALPRIVGAINLSDHYSFWRNGFKAVMITDTAFLRNKHYHAATDLPPTLDYARMADVTDGLEAALSGLTR